MRGPVSCVVWSLSGFFYETHQIVLSKLWENANEANKFGIKINKQQFGVGQNEFQMARRSHTD